MVELAKIGADPHVLISAGTLAEASVVAAHPNFTRLMSQEPCTLRYGARLDISPPVFAKGASVSKGGEARTARFNAQFFDQLGRHRKGIAASPKC